MARVHNRKVGGNMRKILIALLVSAPLLFAQQAPRVFTIQDLFTRNVGNTEQQNKQFPPHKIIGSVGVNPGTNLVGNLQLVEQYRQSFKFLHSADVDVPLGSHPAMYSMAEKYAKLKSSAPSPFIDPAGFQNEIAIQETALNNELKRQQVEGSPPPRAGGRRGQD
jgi:hypothetical protein